ncbi:MAG: UvrD-helicase domain-containing protein [Bacteroidetes bacterium]|nr:UvrD-helicase domain-containing protein [Bacteroidota bacterium]
MSRFLDELNERQREAAATVAGPVMIIAGAGSGKTRVLTFRAAHLLAEKHAQPWQLLLLTFTNKASREMQGRISAITGETISKGIWMGTFHSVFARILRYEADKIGYTKQFSIYDTEDQESLIKRILADKQVNTQQFPVRMIMSKISSAKNRMWYPADFHQAAVFPADVKAAEVYEEYQVRLKEANSMDFDDLLMKPIELFKARPESLARYQDQFRYLMIDEYQDTNRAQYLISKMLAAKNRNICVVGDDAQSIYSWRGADIQNILDFEKDYPEARVVRLEQNYRSTQRILSVADSVIKANKDQIKKTLWTDNPEGDHITLIEADSERDESTKIAACIQNLKITKGYQNRDFAILYRTNAQSRAMEDGLRRISVPYIIIGGIQFYKRKEVKDVLAYLKMLINPKDEESFRRIINYPARGIGETALNRLLDYAHQANRSPVELLQSADMIGGLNAKQRQSLTELGQAIQSTRSNLSNSPLGLLIRTYIEQVGILRDLGQEQTQEGRARVENVQELINAIEEFAAGRTDASLDAFLQEVALVTDVDNLDGERNAVTLMTLHAAKGLEFPVVFLAGLEDGLFPLSGAMDDPRQMEEERRLCYVGVTRAEKLLFLSHAKTRFRFGQSEYTIRSRFIDEMDLTHIRTEGRVQAESKPRQAAFMTGLGDSSREEYSQKNPYYWRDEKYKNQKSSSKERTVVYDSGQADIRAGVYVQHAKFGKGRVESVAGSGDTRKAVVHFIGAGVKTLVLKFANLQVVR